MNFFPWTINFFSSFWSFFYNINASFSWTCIGSLIEDYISFIIFFYIINCTSYIFTFFCTISFYIYINYFFRLLFFINAVSRVRLTMNMAINISFSISCSIDDTVWWTSIWITLESFISSFWHNIITWQVNVFYF